MMTIRVEFTGMGGDRSINGSYSHRFLTISSLLKNEKKKKKRNPEVIGKKVMKTAM